MLTTGILLREALAMLLPFHEEMGERGIRWSNRFMLLGLVALLPADWDMLSLGSGA